MAKKIKTIIKLQAPAGKANPAPPIGPALGQHGLNIMEFVNQFNAQTQITPFLHVFPLFSFIVLTTPGFPVLLPGVYKILPIHELCCRR